MSQGHLARIVDSSGLLDQSVLELVLVKVSLPFDKYFPHRTWKGQRFMAVNCVKINENQYSLTGHLRFCSCFRWTHYVDMMTLFMLWNLTRSFALPGELTFLRSSFVLDLMESNDGSL